MIRKFELNDIDDVMKIWLNVNIKAHHFINDTYWKDNYQKVKYMLPQSDIYVYCNENNEIQGFIGLTGNYISGIFIKTGSQSQGIGKQLLSRAKQNNNSLTLSVYCKNNRAVNFYLRENFTISSKQIDDNTGEEEFLMVWRPENN